MIDERWLLTSVPEEYRAALYHYWDDNTILSERRMDGPTWLRWYRETFERAANLDSI